LIDFVQHTIDKTKQCLDFVESSRIEELPVIKYGVYDKIFSLEDWNKFVGGGPLTAPLRMVYMQSIEKLKFELHEIHAGLGTVLFMLKAA